MGWSGRSPSGEFKPGYLAEFIIRSVDKKSRRFKVELNQVPAVEGALMTLNAKTGEIVAMQGGYDFLTNKFNNAVQAYRQTGSAFKPFIYTAAVEWGMTPETAVSGAPISIGGWTPHNYNGSTQQRRHAFEDGAGAVDEHSGGALAANRRHSDRRADGASLWNQGADGALSAVSVGRH